MAGGTGAIVGMVERLESLPLAVTTDPAVVLPLAQAMLRWRSEHLDRNLTGFWLRDGGVGRRPFVPD